MTESILEMQAVKKSFPGVQALKGVDFSVLKGEIHALVGQNGAGKSTLLKILSGVYHADSGSVMINGEKLTRWSSQEMIERGISFIYQELNLVQSLSVAQNIYIGREPRNAFGLINWNTMRAGAQEALARIGAADLDVDMPVKQLTVAKQQLVAIARALDMAPTLLILDEPTSRLGLKDTEKLFTLLQKMQEDGLSIIYVSHRLSEIYRISNRITVLRDGQWIATQDACYMSPRELVQNMVGKDVADQTYTQEKPYGDFVLELNDLQGENINGVNLKLRKNEVLGLIGAVGAGKTETVRALFGIDKLSAGTIKVGCKEMKHYTPTEAISLGMALCPEDRKYQGLLLDNSISENITLAGLRKFTNWKWFPNRKQEISTVVELVKKLRIATPSIKKNTRSLSGGNQQKVVLAKWLCTSSQVFVFDEPTIGIDVQSKAEIYELMHELAGEGAGVLFVTSDIEEGLQVSDRVLVMYKGKIIKELYPGTTTKEEVSLFAMGGTPDEQH